MVDIEKLKADIKKDIDEAEKGLKDIEDLLKLAYDLGIDVEKEEREYTELKEKIEGMKAVL